MANRVRNCVYAELNPGGILLDNSILPALSSLLLFEASQVVAALFPLHVEAVPHAYS